MICKECGKVLSDYRETCTYCGAPQPGAVPRPASHKKKKFLRLLWVLLGVIIIIAAAVLILLKLL